jgi:hypothetical protein
LENSDRLGSDFDAPNEPIERILEDTRYAMRIFGAADDQGRVIADLRSPVLNRFR